MDNNYEREVSMQQEWTNDAVQRLAKTIRTSYKNEEHIKDALGIAVFNILEFAHVLLSGVTDQQLPQIVNCDDILFQVQHLERQLRAFGERTEFFESGLGHDSKPECGTMEDLSSRIMMKQESVIMQASNSDQQEVNPLKKGKQRQKEKVKTDSRKESASKDKEASHECGYCGETFTKLGHLCSHYKNVHSGTISVESFNCRYCNHEVMMRHNLVKHILEYHPEFSDKGFFICGICREEFENNVDLEQHLDNFHPRVKFICRQCGHLSPSKSGLEIHVACVHEKKRPFICDFCGKSYGRKHTLLYHINRAHKKLRPFVCSVCSAGFVRESELRRHIKVTHDGEKRFQCEFCEVQYYFRRQMIEHIEEVHFNETYTCPICAVHLKKRYRLKQHIESFHLGMEEYQCNICSKRFSEKNQLKKHVRLVHEKDYRYPCTHCHKKFGTSYNLKVHVKNVHLKLGRNKVTTKSEECVESDAELVDSLETPSIDALCFTDTLSLADPLCSP